MNQSKITISRLDTIEREDINVKIYSSATSYLVCTKHEVPRSGRYNGGKQVKIEHTTLSRRGVSGPSDD